MTTMDDFEILKKELFLSQSDLAMVLGISQSMLSKASSGNRSLGPLADAYLSQAIRVFFMLQEAENTDSTSVNTNIIHIRLKEINVELQRTQNLLLKMENEWKAGLKKRAWVQKMRSEPEWVNRNMVKALNRFERDAGVLISSNPIEQQNLWRLQIKCLELQRDFWKQHIDSV
jgi:transcriptional regulator with XRE-family HTH domain